MIAAHRLLLCLAVVPAFAAAQTYPSRAVRLIVPSSPGSGFDVIGRIAAGGLAEDLGQQVIVDNRTGANGNIGAEIASKAPADGYTLLLGAASHPANMILYKSLSFDFVRDFAPVSLLASSPSVVTVHPSLPVKTVGELVRLAKARPGQLNYGSTGTGSTSYIGAEMLKDRAGIDIVHVPYRGGGEAATAAVAGEITVYVPPLAPALPHIQSGKLRLLAVTGAQRIALLPTAPTVAESGYPGFEFGSWNGILVPAKTPKEIVARLHAATMVALKNPAVAKRMADSGYVVAGNTPEQFSKFIQSELDTLGRILRNLKGTME